MIDPSEESWDTRTKIVGSYSFENDSGWLCTGHSTFLQDGEQDYILQSDTASGNWSFDQNDTLLLEWKLAGEIMLKKSFSAAWDWENWKETIAFTGLDDSGTAV